jgi:hypothetical protein
MIVMYVEDNKAPPPLPPMFNIGAFYYPKGFHTVLSSLKQRSLFFYDIIGLFSAILQSSARSIALPIDQLKFNYQVLDNGEEYEILQSSTVSFKDYLYSMVYISNYSQHVILLMVL